VEKVDQSKYNKILSFYDYLKNQHYDKELKIIARYLKVIGQQWSKQDLEYLRNQKRPALTYNIMLPIMLFLMGTQKQNRANMKAFPEGNGSYETSELLTKLLYHNYDLADYPYELSKQFTHCIIASVAWAHNFWDNALNHWNYRAYDGLRIRYDLQTSRASFKDCRFLQDTQWLTAPQAISLAANIEEKAEAFKFFKDYEPDLNSDAFYEKAQRSNFQRYKFALRGDLDFVDFKEGRYRVIEHHEQRDIVDRWLKKTDGSNEKIDVSKWNYEQIRTAMNNHKGLFTFKENPRTEFWKTTICPAINFVLSEEPYENQTGVFSWIPMVCYDIMPEVYNSIGVFDNIEDVQDSYNKRESLLLEYVTDTVGGTYVAEEGAVTGHESDWLGKKSVRGLRVYNTGYNKPERERPGVFPDGLFRYAGEEFRKPEYITGISPNMKGFKESANESGRLFNSKIAQGEVMLAALFDNVEICQKLGAFSCIKHIQMYMPDDEIVHLSDDAGEIAAVEINYNTVNGTINNIREGNFRITLDGSKPSPDARRVQFYEMMEMVRTGMPPQFVAWDLILEASDVSKKKEWAERIRGMYRSMGIDITNPAELAKLNPSNPQAQQFLQSMQGQMGNQLPKANDLILRGV
jgi:hypothetical protein